MFTGIVEEIGKVKSIKKGKDSAQLFIQAEKIMEDVCLGHSIAVNGVCLTVTSFDAKGFSADVMHETLSRSSLGALRSESPVNLERAMVSGGRFGGHIVSGHIDGVGKIIKIRKDDNAVWYTISTEKALMKYIIEKGSIAIDGISLTVAALGSDYFKVSIIPHTIAETTLAFRKLGDTVNLENDCIGKYVERLMNFDKSNITKEFLIENGF